MPFKVDTLKTRRLKADAVLAAQRGESWTLAGDCTSPVLVRLSAYDTVAMTTDRKAVKRRSEKGEQVETDVRCRKCEACQRARRNFWAARACTEQGRAERTFFLTLTFRPQERLRIEALLERKLAAAGLTLRGADGCTAIDDLPQRLGDEVRPLVAKFWKRLRKRTGERWRYFAAFEYHKDGWPHVHALVHARAGAVPDGKDARGFPAANQVFADTWGLGFTYTVPVAPDDPDKAFYVAKYVAKQGGRIAASQAYGRAALADLASRGDDRGKRSASPAGTPSVPAGLASPPGAVQDDGRPAVEPLSNRTAQEARENALRSED